MPFEWPYEPVYPEEDDGLFFVPLADDQPELAERLRRIYADRWIAKGHLRPPRIEDAMDTIELTVAPDERTGCWRLRLRSFYMGVTSYYSWDGSESQAVDFVEARADDDGQGTGEDRRDGPLLWDDVPRPEHHNR